MISTSGFLLTHFFYIPWCQMSDPGGFSRLSIGDGGYDALKPRGLLTTRQPAEDSWMSGNPTPHHHVPFFRTHDLMKIG